MAFGAIAGYMAFWPFPPQSASSPNGAHLHQTLPRAPPPPPPPPPPLPPPRPQEGKAREGGGGGGGAPIGDRKQAQGDKTRHEAHIHLRHSHATGGCLNESAHTLSIAFSLPHGSLCASKAHADSRVSHPPVVHCKSDRAEQLQGMLQS